MTPPGHDDMQMRVVVESPAVCVQDGAEAGLALEVAVVARKALERRGGRAEQGVVDRGRLLCGEGSQPLGQGEGDHEVRHRQQLRLLAGKPG